MRGPRYLPEPSLVEITVRTIQSRFLLLLTQIVVDTILGVIARAQARYGVAVIDVKQMSSHLHLLCFFEDGQQMASFLCASGLRPQRTALDGLAQARLHGACAT